MIKGSIPALVTPFKNGELDLDTLKHLVEWQIAEGSTGLVPVGTTGGVHAGVIFYSAPPGSTTEADLILSWK